jgi:PKD repeat protein
MKLNEEGNGLVWSTYFGSAGHDFIKCIFVDVSDDVYIAGSTFSRDLPTTSGAYQADHKGWQDGFVCKLSSDGSKLLRSTYLGGEDDDEVNDIVVDVEGMTYITGSTESHGYPATEGAFQTHHADSQGGSLYDTFVTKLTPDFGRLEYSTYIGGSRGEQGNGIVVDGAGYAYIAGLTWSGDFNWSMPEEQLLPGGAQNDGFLCKLSLDGSTLLRSLKIGGSETEEGNAIAMDTKGNVYMTGSTRSPSLPVTPNAIQREYIEGSKDVLLIKLNQALDRIEHLTYLGGEKWDEAHGIVVDRFENAIITGRTESEDFPLIGNASQTSWAGGYFDVFLTVIPTESELPVPDAGPDTDTLQFVEFGFDGTGSTDNVEVILWSWTFVYNGTNVTLEGPTPTYTFDIPGRYEIVLNVSDMAGNWATGRMNLTVIDILPPVAVTGPSRTIDQHQEVKFDGSNSTDNVGVVEWSWSFQDGDETKVLSGPRPTYVFKEAGEYLVELTVTDAAGNFATDTLMVTIMDTTPPAADAGTNITVDQREEALFDGTASTDNVAVTNWTWRFTYEGTEHVLHGGSPSFIFQVVGIFEVTMEVRDEVGNIASDALSVTVADVTPPHAVAGSNRTVERNEIVTFDASASTDNVGVINWTWTFNVSDSEIVSYEEIRYWRFHKEGEYQVHLTVRDGNGNEDSTQITVVVKGPPEHVNDLPIWFYALIIAVIAMVILLAVVGVIKVIKKGS